MRVIRWAAPASSKYVLSNVCDQDVTWKNILEEHKRKAQIEKSCLQCFSELNFLGFLQYVRHTSRSSVSVVGRWRCLTESSAEQPSNVKLTYPRSPTADS